MDDRVDQVLLRVRPAPLPAGDRETTLRLLAEEVAEFLPAAEAQGSGLAIFEDTWQREQAEPTYVGMGLAVPHARVSGLPQAGVYLAYSQCGIPWPYEEAHLIALLIVPWENPEMHLQLLSRLARWRKNLTEAEILSLAESPDKLIVSLDEAFLDML